MQADDVYANPQIAREVAVTLGEVVRTARKERQVSQKELATRLKNKDGDAISPQYLNDIELDRRIPPEY